MFGKNVPKSYQYLIVPAESDTETFLTRAVGAHESKYVSQLVVPRLRPLSDIDYTNGPHGIRETGAPYSYVLYEACVLWCIEWDPGLLVVRFSPDGQFASCALRSPNPEFGGRSATESELATFDEDAPNPQYDLVFNAWDAQSDPFERRGWKRASPGEVKVWQSAMARANEISSALDSLSAEERELWLERCEASPIWLGEDEH